MERILEPEVMDDAAHALAYARADFADVNRGFVDRFRTAFPDLAGSRVVDLGCGPGDIAIRLARVLPALAVTAAERSEEHTSELQSQSNLVCRLLLEKKKK